MGTSSAASSNQQGLACCVGCVFCPTYLKLAYLQLVWINIVLIVVGFAGHCTLGEKQLCICAHCACSSLHTPSCRLYTLKLSDHLQHLMSVPGVGYVWPHVFAAKRLEPGVYVLFCVIQDQDMCRDLNQLKHPADRLLAAVNCPACKKHRLLGRGWILTQLWPPVAQYLDIKNNMLVTWLRKPHRDTLHNCDKTQACSV